LKGLDAQDGESFAERTVIDSLQERGIIDEILGTLQRPVDFASAEKRRMAPPPHTTDPKKKFQRCLHLKLLGGKAFVQCLPPPSDQNGEEQSYDPSTDPDSFFQLHFHFKGQV
jgi:hypothetical protein